MRGSVHWSGYDDTALDIEVYPQRCRFGSRKSDFALQALVECRWSLGRDWVCVGIGASQHGKSGEAHAYALRDKQARWLFSCNGNPLIDGRGCR